VLALPEYAIRDNTIHHTDLFSLCRALPSQSVDMILCDLPYGTTACSWDSIIPMEPMWDAFKRIIKPRGAIVLTATEPFASRLRMSWIDGYKYDWVWDKRRHANFFNAKVMPLMHHELILVFGFKPVYFPQDTQRVDSERTKYPRVHGRYKKQNGGAFVGGHKEVIDVHTNTTNRYPGSILEFARDSFGNLHPTQKPVALFEYLIKTYTQPGELVFDPCVGSGTTAVAAHKTGRRYICGDITREYVDIARQRVIDSDPYQPKKVSDSATQLSLFEEPRT